MSTKVNTLARTLAGVKDLEIKRMRGGSYNRVVMARLIMDMGPDIGGIFQIPRFAFMGDEGVSGEDKTDQLVQDRDAVLYHWNLEPRNILVKLPAGDLESDAVVQFETVIDWDDVLVVPSVLTRRPPVWLWENLDKPERPSWESGFDFDYDLLKTLRYDLESGKISEDDCKIKQHFEKTFIDRMSKIYPGYNDSIYRDEAYGRGRWIRRIARFAIYGARDNQDFKRYDQLVEDWKSFKKQS